MPETNLGFRYPAGSDTPDVPRDIQFLADDANEQEIITLMGAWA
jgi:hypothetical protein